MSFLDPLPFDSAVETLDRPVKRDQIISAFLANPKKLRGVTSLNHCGNGDEEKGNGGSEGNPVFHVSRVSFGPTGGSGVEILKSDSSGNDGNHKR